MARLPAIYVIQASDAPQHTGKLQEIIQNLKTEDRVERFATLGAGEDLSSLTDTVQEEDLVLVVLTNQLEPQKERIEDRLRTLRTTQPSVRVAEIIVDNVVYDNEFLTFPADLRPLSNNEDTDAAWSSIEQSLKDMFPAKERQEPVPVPIDWPKYLKIAGILIGVILVFLIIRWIWVDDGGSPKMAEAEEAMETVEESRNIWARGTTCLTPTQAFDLDQGVFDSYGGDLFYENVDGRERYLRYWHSQIAKGGNVPLEQVSFSELKSTQYGNERFDASYGVGEVRPGTTWFVRTSEGRYTKIRILQSGQYMQFQWITYAKETDQDKLAASPLNNGSCSIEEEKNCGTGQLTGDEVRGFNVLEKQSEEAILEVDLAFNPDHGRVIVVPLLLDENGENISGAYRPTLARHGATEVPVLFRLPGRARSAELLIYLFEHGTPGQAFICRRFPFTEQWGS